MLVAIIFPQRNWHKGKQISETKPKGGGLIHRAGFYGPNFSRKNAPYTARFSCADCIEYRGHGWFAFCEVDL